MGDDPRVFAAVVPPACWCAWTAQPGGDWRLTERHEDCPLHGAGAPFDYWTHDT